MRLSSLQKSIIIVLSIIIIDQVVKIIIKTTMPYDHSINVFGDWFKIHFVENTGMAFGLDLGGNSGKLILSIFRIIAVIVIGGYLYKQSKKGMTTGLTVCLSMVLAGALGNIIDSSFYGVLFDRGITLDNPIYSGIAEMNFDGYAPVLYGSVVDMFRFNVIWPEWVPWLGGGEVFPPIFNIADSSITIGIIVLVLFQKRFFRQVEDNNESEEDTSETLIQENITTDSPSPQ